jgi:Fic family protein
MAHYDYLSLSKHSIPVDLVGNIVEMALISERIESWKKFYPEAMSILERKATIDSVYYSNAIELITDDMARVEALIDGAEPVNTHDLKIIGYLNARQFVYETYSDHPFTVEYVLELHRILMSGFDENAGKIRCENRPHRGFCTMTAVSYYIDFSEVEDDLKAMCESVEIAIADGSVDRMMLISSIISDFLSLSPFLNGNGRMYRLLIEYFMLRLNMNAIRYVSLNKELFLDVKRHVLAIHRTSVMKEEGSKDYIPFMLNYLSYIYVIYRKLDSMFP